MPPTFSSFDHLIVSAFYGWGLIAHKWRWPLFLLPFALTALLSYGFTWIKEQTTIDPQYVFSPIDAYWRYERATLSEKWPLNEKRFWPGKSYDYNGYVDIIAAGRVNNSYGRPNMLLSKYLNELERINQYIIHNLTVPLHHNNTIFYISFTDLCMHYEWKCYLNDHILMLQPKERWAAGWREEVVDLAKSIIESEVKITYPIGWRGTEPIYFGALVGGVHLVDGEGHFDYVKAVRLTYNVREFGEVSRQWRREVASYLSNKEEGKRASGGSIFIGGYFGRGHIKCKVEEGWMLDHSPPHPDRVRAHTPLGSYVLLGGGGGL